MMCRRDRDDIMINHTYKLHTADLSQVFCESDRSDENDFASSSVKKTHVDDRDEHNGSIIAKDISRLDLDVSSMFEESSAESRDPVLSENTGSSKLNTSITSPSKAKHSLQPTYHKYAVIMIGLWLGGSKPCVFLGVTSGARQ
eukprot:scaffold993_cov122-Skeletonema_menzelii.AAC.2